MRFPCWNSSTSIKKWMQEHGLAVGDFQGLTRMFWKRFATEVAPVVFNRTGVAIMIGQSFQMSKDSKRPRPAWE